MRRALFAALLVLAALPAAAQLAVDEMNAHHLVQR
jgi:hypothetical protein